MKVQVTDGVISSTWVDDKAWVAVAMAVMVFKRCVKGPVKEDNLIVKFEDSDSNTTTVRTYFNNCSEEQIAETVTHLQDYYSYTLK